jgi:hypothetical protein
MKSGTGIGSAAATGLIALALLALPGCGSDELNSPTAAKLRGIATYFLDLTFARTGKDGKRLAVLANNKVHLVDEAGLEALKSPK